MRVDDDLGDRSPVKLRPTHKVPSRTAVRGFQDTEAVVDVVPGDGELARAQVRLTGAGVDHLGIARRQRDGAHELDRLLIGQWPPGCAPVHRLPDAAARRSDINGVYVRR